MYHTQSASEACADLKGFIQTRYFYGQRLDVRHFESEQNYVKGKLWMLNRMVHGFGVVCGLDVRLGNDHQSVAVLPGLALDKAGREIVVPCQSADQAIPPLDPAATGNAPAAKPGAAKPGGAKPGGATPAEECCDDHYVHVCVCFHACESDPEPVLAGVCDSVERCSPGSIREGYKISVRPGRSPAIGLDTVIPNLLIGNRINYAALAAWVTEPCMCVPPDACIPLANVKRPQPGGALESTDIDISIRPIVYGNDLLYQILLALTGDQQNRRSGK